jgi:transposase
MIGHNHDTRPNWTFIGVTTQARHFSRHKLVVIRVRVKNGLHHLMLNRGIQLKRKLWSKAGQRVLRELPPAGWVAQRRKDLLQLLVSLDEQIETLDEAVLAEAKNHPQAALLMTQPGVGPIAALAFVLTLGDVSRFPRGKQLASYLGLIPSERRLLGGLNPKMRHGWLLHSTAREIAGKSRPFSAPRRT